MVLIHVLILHLLIGWNNKFACAVRRYHANVWHFVRNLQNEQAATDLAQNQDAIGVVIARPRSQRYVRAQQQIVRIQQRFENGEINAAHMLQAISHMIGAFN